ncbi:MAG: SpoIIE family protein phosphatase [Desulfobacterales bacterium]
MISRENRTWEFNARILIAEDDLIQQCIYREYLAEGICGYFSNSPQTQIPLDVRLFSDGAPLLECFRDEFAKGKRIPLCILDMRMDALSGIETAQAVRIIDPDVFIIVITSYEDISHEELMKNLKKDVYFMKKPVRIRELLALVSSLIISWNSQQELCAAYREMDHIRGLLQIFIENTPAAVAMLDARMHYIAHSRRWVSDLGIKKKDLRGCFHYDVLRDIPDHWKKEHARCLCGETVKNFEEEYHHDDGSMDYVNRELHPLKDAEGNTRGMIIFIEFITEKKHAEKAREEAEEKLREREIYLKAIMSAAQTSLMIIEPETYRITDANPYSLQLLGYEKEDLIGKDFYELRSHDEVSDPDSRFVEDEYALQTKNGESIHVRRSVHQMAVKGKKYIVQSLLDMTDIRNLLKKQEISIDLAKHLLGMVNGTPPRNTSLSPGIHLFSQGICLPCCKEGGDHYFIRHLNSGEESGSQKTLVSVKDQSGHQVGCILRSIITDLLHHRIVNNFPGLMPDEMICRLNREICASGVFKNREFFTSLTAAIDHQTLELCYVSAGHPRFLLIRGDKILALPEHGSAGRNLPIPILPDKRFSQGKCRLQTGDRLIFYTDGLSDIFAGSEREATPFENLRAAFADMICQSPDSTVSDLIYGIFSRVPQSPEIQEIPLSRRTFPDDITVLGLEIEDSANWHEKTLLPESLDTLNDRVLHLYGEMSGELKKREFVMENMALRSVLSEACVNAWKHGNREDKDKAIRIRWRYGNDFHLEIQDQGEGFDFQQIYDPKCPKNVNRTSGRGLFIIRHYSDSLHWEDRGTRMIASFRKQRSEEA